MDRPFADAARRPTEVALESTVGRAFGRYESILRLAAAFSQEWNFSKAGGWMLKVHHRKKALLYLIPLVDGFRISMAIREPEREAFLHDPDLASLHDNLASARKFSEGFAVQFDVDDATDSATVEPFVSKLIAARR
jgi:hypothetical protein